MVRRLAICLVGWCRLAAKEKGESFDSPFFFIYKLSDLEFIPIIYTSVARISKFEIIVFSVAFILYFPSLYEVASPSLNLRLF